MRQVMGSLMTIDDVGLVKTLLLKIAGGKTEEIKMVNFDSRNAEGEKWNCTCRATVECRHIKFGKAVQNFMDGATGSLLNFDTKTKPTVGVSFNAEAARKLNE